MGGKNPVWSQEELLLTLNEYFSHDVTWFNSGKNSMKELAVLSKILGGLDIYNGKNQKPMILRSAKAVDAKIQNFKSFDPEYIKTGKGLSHSGKGDGLVFQQYYKDKEKLHKKCSDLIIKHFKGEMTDDVRQYLASYFGFTETIINHENTVIVSVHEDLDQKLMELKKLAVQVNNDQFVSLVNESCARIKDAFEKCDEITATPISKLTKEKIITNHAGINWELNKPNSKVNIVNPNMEKIGVHVRRIMRQLSKNDILTKEQIDRCSNYEWSKKNMHLTVPMLKKYQGNNSNSKETIDNNGHIRYWKEVFTFGKYGDYLVTKEWFENGKSRQSFDHWYKNVVSDYFGVTVDKMMLIFKAIQILDEENKPIKMEDFSKDYGITNPLGFFERLSRIGMLILQGDSKSYTLDDYDFLYDVLGE